MTIRDEGLTQNLLTHNVLFPLTWRIDLGQSSMSGISEDGFSISSLESRGHAMLSLLLLTSEFRVRIQHNALRFPWHCIILRSVSILLLACLTRRRLVLLLGNTTVSHSLELSTLGSCRRSGSRS